MSYIGDKQIKEVKETGEKTPGDVPLIEVEYEDELKEIFSKPMYDASVSETPCDASALRDKRIKPIVGTLLAFLREWGIKVGELSYMSSLLTQSLTANRDEAERQLWLRWNSTIKSLDDVDLLTIDRVLKTKNDQSIPSPYNPK